MFNFNKKGVPVAKIVGGNKNKQKLYLDKKIKKRRKKKNFKICPYCEREFTRSDNALRHVQNSCRIKQFLDYNSELAAQDGGDSSRKFREINLEDGIMVPLPRKDYRENLYICGPAGSGKSYYTTQYLKEFKKAFPNKPIILFTCIPNDENFRNMDIMKIMIDEELLEEPIDVKTELNNSIVVLDDIIASNNRDLTRYLINLRDDILMNGRDQANEGNDIYSVSTSHLLSDYKNTRLVLLECTSITLFPQSGIGEYIRKVLKTYFGLGKNQIDKILELESRWCTLYRRYPMFIIHETGAYLL